MKSAKWIIGAVLLLGIAGLAFAFGRSRVKRVILYNQFRQRGLPNSVARSLATYWPERLLSWTLQAAKRYDRRAAQAKKQATKVLHLPGRPHFSVRRMA